MGGRRIASEGYGKGADEGWLVCTLCQVATCDPCCSQYSTGTPPSSPQPYTFHSLPTHPPNDAQTSASHTMTLGSLGIRITAEYDA
jgi:hypothetical protein